METSEGPKINRRVILAGAAGIGAFAALGKVQGAEAQTPPATSTLTPQQIQDRAEEVQKAQDRAKAAEQARIAAQTSQVSPVRSPMAQATQESSHPPPGPPGSEAIVTLPVVGPVDNKVSLVTAAALLAEAARGGKDLVRIKKIWDRRKKEGDVPVAGTTAGEKGRHWWQRGGKKQAEGQPSSPEGNDRSVSPAAEAQPLERVRVRRGDSVKLPDGTFKLLAEVFTTPIPSLSPDDQALLTLIQKNIVGASGKILTLSIDGLSPSLLTNRQVMEALIKDSAKADKEIKLGADDWQLAEQVAGATGIRVEPLPNENAYDEITRLGILINPKSSVEELIEQLKPRGWQGDPKTLWYVQSAISFFQQQSIASSAS